MARRTAPLYLELRNTLMEELEAGKYPIGSRFPTEHELQERFGYARHTVREALRGLQESGLILRRTKTGTVVLALRPTTSFSSKINSLDELWQYAKNTRFEPLYEHIITLRSNFAEMLGRSPGERWLQMAGYRRHMHDPTPLSWSEIYVAEPYIGIRPMIDHLKTPVYALLSEHFELTIEKVDRQLRAVAMPQEVCEHLKCAVGSPALLERRSFYAKDKGVFQITLSLHPGDRYSHNISLVREKS